MRFQPSPLSWAFQNDALMDTETLLRGWRIVLIREQDVMFLIEGNLVFHMKPANTKLLTVSPYTPF